MKGSRGRPIKEAGTARTRLSPYTKNKSFDSLNLIGDSYVQGSNLLPNQANIEKNNKQSRIRIYSH